MSHKTDQRGQPLFYGGPELAFAPSPCSWPASIEVNFAVVSNTNALELWDMTSKGKLGECVAQRFELVDDI